MSNFSNYWYLFLTKELVYQIRVKKTKYNSKMLDFNKNQSNDEYSINNNNDSSNSKTPVSKLHFTTLCMKGLVIIHY